MRLPTFCLVFCFCFVVRVFPSVDQWRGGQGGCAARRPSLLKKNQTTPRPSEHPPVMGEKMSKRLGGINIFPCPADTKKRDMQKK